LGVQQLDGRFTVGGFPIVNVIAIESVDDDLTAVCRGLAVANVYDTTWEQLVKDRILGPLGMKNTYTDVNSAIASGDYAIPVTTDPKSGKVVPLPADVNSLLTAVAPAGILR
jgi:CubicO group peptidase (beta-lactamase class C family)